MDIAERLIAEVHQHACLYDAKDKRYKNILHKEMVWAHIAKRLHLDVDSCKKRWKGLRDTFKRCQRLKILSSSSGEPAIKCRRKKWRYYKIMEFLDDEQSHKNSTLNVPLEDNPISEEAFPADIEFANCLDENSWLPSICSNSSPNVVPPLNHSEKKDAVENFTNFLQTATTSVEEISKYLHNKPSLTSTEMLFASLSKMLVEAKIPARTLHVIEKKIALIVFDEINNQK